MANEKNWIRTYTLKAGSFVIGNTKSMDQETLHISFSVEKSGAESANTAKVQIWNLSDQNLKTLEEKDCAVELKAGYGNNNTLLLAGNAAYVVTVADNADRMTELTVVDGRVALRDTNVKISLNGVVGSKTVYGIAASKMGLSIKYAPGLKFKKIPNGYSFVGKARTVLDKMARCCGHTWSVQNGIIHVIADGKPVSTQGYLLSHETGLIGVPKRIAISKGGKSKKEQAGYEVQYFLNGAIGINDTVKIKTDSVNGHFRIHKVVHDGDNMEGDWVSTAQVIQI